MFSARRAIGGDSAQTQLAASASVIDTRHRFEDGYEYNVRTSPRTRGVNQQDASRYIDLAWHGATESGLT